MTDSTARQLGYRLLVGSELELLAATNNQESDAHIRWQNTNPWEVLGERTGPSLHSDHSDIAADGNVRRLLVAPAAGCAAAERVPGGVLPCRARPRGGTARTQPGRARPVHSYQPVPDRAMDRRGVARGRGPCAVWRHVRSHGHRQARAMVGRKHAEQRRRRALGRSAADYRGRGHRKLTALYKQRGVAPCPTG